MDTLSDRNSRKPVIVLGMILSGLGEATIALAKNYGTMLIGTSLIEVWGGSTFVGIMVSMTETLASRIGLTMGCSSWPPARASGRDRWIIHFNSFFR